MHQHLVVTRPISARIERVVLLLVVIGSPGALLAGWIFIPEDMGALRAVTVFGAAGVWIIGLTELVGKRRGWVPLPAAIVTLGLTWWLSPDPMVQVGTWAQMLIIAMLVVLMRPALWRWALGGAVSAFVVIGAAGVALDRFTAISLVLPYGMTLLGSCGAIIMIALLDEARRQSDDRHQSFISMSGVPIMQVSYRAVLAEYERLRRESVADLRVHVAQNPSAIRQLAALIEIEMVNDAAVDLSDRTLHGDVADRLGLPAETAAVVERELYAIWEGVTTLQHEYCVRDREGATVWLRQTWAVELDPDHVNYGLGVLNTLDVTATKNAERLLADQIEAKDEFIASISHELRTPLSAVVGFATELRDQDGSFSPDENAELVGMIADQSVEVANIVDDLLVAARLESESLTIRSVEFDVAALIDEMNLGLDVECASVVVSVNADPDRVRQIVRNLHANSLRYGGTSIRITCSSRLPMAEIDVRDDGPPIPREVQTMMFEPYESTGHETGLTTAVGLGLTVSRRLANLMGGDLSYDHDGTESVFTLLLPGVDAPSQPPSADRGRATSSSRRSRDPSYDPAGPPRPS